MLRLRSDEQLVALLRAGHDEAFSVIHDRYRARLLAYALQMLRSRQDAEDVLQDVFERAYLSLRRAPEDRALSLRPWLYRIAHNRCIDQLRRPAPPPPESLIALGAQCTDPVAEVDRRDALRRLMIDVGRLPEQQRSALLMRELGGISYADVAAALGVTVPAVKSLLVRARVSLVQAGEARDTACDEIRAELVVAHEGRVRPNARARRHMRDCQGCREFRGDLRGVRRQLLGVAPAVGPIGLLARLISGGGTGGGAAAAWSGSTATGAGGGILTATANFAASASHVATLVAATVVTAGGAAAIDTTVTAHVHRHRPPASPARHAAVAAAPARVAVASAAGGIAGTVTQALPAVSIVVTTATGGQPVAMALVPATSPAAGPGAPATAVMTRPRAVRARFDVLDSAQQLAPDPGAVAGALTPSSVTASKAVTRGTASATPAATASSSPSAAGTSTSTSTGASTGSPAGTSTAGGTSGATSTQSTAGTTESTATTSTSAGGSTSTAVQPAGTGPQTGTTTPSAGGSSRVGSTPPGAQPAAST